MNKTVIGMDKINLESDSQDSRQAKQRASVKWILSKAFNNRVPDHLKEPFYRDHEGHEHLKPQIVVGLGNASLYCQTLSNLYSDPNYQSLNHWSILQTLSRKGVSVADSPDQPLTETVLIQTNPLRINAHMIVIEALMILYAKEVATSDRLSPAIGRISGGVLPMGIQGYESGLLCWVSYVCAALKKRIDQEESDHPIIDENGVRHHSPDMPPIRDYKDLCDGVCLAFLISYYCPILVPWTTVRVNYMPTVEDSIHNVLLVSNFSQKHLPYSVFHMTPEDITYMRGTMRQNLVVLLADLFNLFEIHPAKCVCYPGMDQQNIEVDRSPGINEHGIAHRRGVTCQPVTPIPDLRSNLDSPMNSPTTKPSFQVIRSPSASTIRKSTPPKDSHDVTDEGFVVHKSRGVTTLSSMQEPLVPARLRQAKEKTNSDSKSEERGDTVAAGRPSNWEEQRRPSFAGRRSRRNSLSEDSQLTIENFGGSQDQINMIGRTAERERTNSNISAEPAVAVRSSAQDARGTLQIGYDNDSGSEKQDRETEKIPIRRQNSSENISLRNIIHSKEKDFEEQDISRITGNFVHDEDNSKKRTTFATLPNTTTWQQQSAHLQQMENNSEQYLPDENRPLVDASKLSTIRMKLEEKRRHIEQEKRKMEIAMSHQQQKVGKAAFLQAINKAKTQIQPDEENRGGLSQNVVIDKPERPCSLQDITSDVSNIEAAWDDSQFETKKTPDLEHMDIEQYQQSIAMMNSSLHDIQADIQRLANQQTQIQAQHLQAQQLLQAQQIANMINQYGSQQNITSGYRSIQQNFGSSPHLSQTYGLPGNYPMRPNRDSQQQQNQYVNEQGQYVSQNIGNNRQNYSRENQFPADNGQFMRSDSQYSNSSKYGHLHGEHNLYTSNQYLNKDPYFQQDTNQFRDQISQSREMSQPTNQFYLHESPAPAVPQRRTWAQSAISNQQIPLDINAWSQNSPKMDNKILKSPIVQSGGFVLHQNGSDYDNQELSYQNLFSINSSPQHNRVHQQISKMITNVGDSEIQPQPRDSHMPQSPPIDDMAPQSISFIGDEDISDPLGNNAQTNNRAKQSIQQDLEVSLGKLNISSGSRTYRIPSPTRPSLNSKSFQDPNVNDVNEKGFYISFDNDQPKRPKPPLRTKKSPKKDRDLDNDKLEQISQFSKELAKESVHQGRYGQLLSNENNSIKQIEEPSSTRHIIETNMDRRNLTDTHYQGFDRRHLEDVTNHPKSNNNNSYVNDNKLHERDNKTLIIGTELSTLDPDSVDEMERKKEKIMLLSLQRRQQQEEAKARKEIEVMQRREREQEKEEERIKKREEQSARRSAILEAYKLKKAFEEAEREGKIIDKSDLLLMKQQNLNPATVRRPQKTTRPRPKTIHIETGSVDLNETSSLISRSKKGSNTNLTGVGTLSSNSMRRDYYRGSQDSLAIRESPDEYPSTSSTPLGRRGSYKTREPSTIERGRTLSRISVTKGSAANFRGRKSNSLMNLCDTDSGLGRATPPRRAPSPGMGPSGRHLPSPSGPGSLPPGFMTKRRIFDDGSSDISSTPSSMLEYSGPKLYKQPAAKSNRGIILNAVEYCVFPGAVNKEAKQKVLEKIARSEAKHFLILFRDAGCQFRALYGYWPENETVHKLYGTGPSQVDDVMFDKFFKYNSGGKCFSQIHTKHLTVTIDAFTIHNSLWQGKKVNLPSKKDMALVI